LSWLSNLSDEGVRKMTDSNKELIEVLKGIKTQLGDIKYDLADIKRGMPKVPYYGDLLQDIVNAIENIRK
jgi:hypothetical protein